MTTIARPPILMRQLSSAQLRALDVVHALAVGLVCWLSASEQPVPAGAGWVEPTWVTVLATVLLVVPVAVRRRHPLPAAGAVVTVTAAALISGVVPDYAGAGPLLAVGMVLYTVGTSVPVGRSLLAAGLATVVIVVALLIAADSPFGPRAAESGFGILVIGSFWALGWVVRERRSFAARSAEQATARAVDEERLRIAREVHDIVAHSMSLIAVKATIANHVADDRPDEVRAALQVIESASREALMEMKRTLSALRTRTDIPTTPSVHDLPRLVAAAESAGLEVELEEHGADAVGGKLGLAVFRIVQEGLTNVVKHASASRCRVVVSADAETIRVVVSDNGRGATVPAGLPGSPGGPGSAGDGDGGASDAGEGGGTFDTAGGGSAERLRAGGGQGLVGMRERVALYGGTVHAGPAPEGGWRIEATLDARS